MITLIALARDGAEVRVHRAVSSCHDAQISEFGRYAANNNTIVFEDEQAAVLFFLRYRGEPKDREILAMLSHETPTLVSFHMTLQLGPFECWIEAPDGNIIGLWSGSMLDVVCGTVAHDAKGMYRLMADRHLTYIKASMQVTRR